MAEGGSLPHSERTQDGNSSNNAERLPYKNLRKPVCKYYAHGVCADADDCQFLHIKPSACSWQNAIEDHIRSGKGVNTGRFKCRVKSPFSPAARKEENESDNERVTAKEWISVRKLYPLQWELSKRKIAREMGSLRKTSMESKEKTRLCRYGQGRNCKYGNNCKFKHSELCEICKVFCLDSCDESEREKHKSECVKKYGRHMEISRAFRRSRDKTCGICFEVIIEKDKGDWKFGILPNCNHCFCLPCIMKWRKTESFNIKVRRGCPQCRESSDFVCPSFYWVDKKEEKEKLILDYKNSLSSKDCKHFQKGRRRCPFGNKCFFLHALPDGTVVDVGPPAKPKQHNVMGNTEMSPHVLHWDIFEDQESQWSDDESIADLDDIFAFYSDSLSDDNEW